MLTRVGPAKDITAASIGREEEVSSAETVPVGETETVWVCVAPDTTGFSEFISVLRSRNQGLTQTLTLTVTPTLTPIGDHGTRGVLGHRHGSNS